MCLQCIFLLTQVWSLGWEDPLEREWLANPLFLPGEFHGQRNLEVYSPQGHKESDMTEQLILSLLLFWPELYVSNSSVNQDQFLCHKSSSQEREYDWLSFGQLFSAHIPPLNCLHVQLHISTLKSLIQSHIWFISVLDMTLWWPSLTISIVRTHIQSNNNSI